jgi:hypothetical protein
MSTIFAKTAASDLTDRILLPGEARPEWLPSSVFPEAEALSTEYAARAEQRLDDLQARLACMRKLTEAMRTYHPAGWSYDLPPAATWGFAVEAASVVFGTALARIRDLGPHLDRRNRKACSEAWTLFEQHIDSIRDGELDVVRRDEMGLTESVVACALEWLAIWTRAEAERQLGHAVAQNLLAA